MKYNKVLVASDFSKPAQALLPCIGEMKSIGLREVVLVHVIDVRVYSYEFGEQNKKRLDEEKQSISAMGLEVKAIVSVGFPEEKIIEIAEAEEVDFIVMGSHGKGYLKEILLGSTSAGVIRRSKIPVLIEKYQDIDNENYQPHCVQKFKKLLIPTDFSVCADRVLDMVKEMGDNIEEILVVSVVEIEEFQALTERMQKKADQKLDHIKKNLSERGFKVSVMSKLGIASNNIVMTAEEEGATMIILSTRGQGLLKHILLGSTAEAVAKKSQKPVLLIPCIVNKL